MQAEDDFDEDANFEDPTEGYDIEEDEPSLTPQTSVAAHGLPYRIVPIEDVMKLLSRRLDEIDEVLNIGLDWQLVFYANCRWNVDRLKQDYFANQEKFLKQMHYTGTNYVVREKQAQCVICTEFNNRFIDLGCHHEYCWNCWKDYTLENLSNKVVFFRCMREGCYSPVVRSLIEKLLESSPSKLALYNKFLGEKFVQTNSEMKFCPGADCNKCISSKETTLKEVECSCGTRFCFKCREKVHRPCDCFQARKWKDIVEKEEANAKWLSLNTKICPWCHKNVERSTGCNFMACAPPGGCGKSFCYVCSRPWQPDHKDHFKCNVYKGADNEQQRLEKEKNILAKINFYCEKYLSNQHGATKLKEFCAKSQDIRNDFFSLLGLQLIDTEFIPHVYEFAVQACDVLKWSYAFRYFMNEGSKHKDVFQIQQADFEKFKENLLFKLETKLIKLHNEIKEAERKNIKLSEQELAHKRSEFAHIKEEIQSFYKSAQRYMGVLINTVENEMI